MTNGFFLSCDAELAVRSEGQRGSVAQPAGADGRLLLVRPDHDGVSLQRVRTNTRLFSEKQQQFSKSQQNCLTKTNVRTAWE